MNRRMDLHMKLLNLHMNRRMDLHMNVRMNTVGTS
jgi:hypothetical protein